MKSAGNIAAMGGFLMKYYSRVSSMAEFSFEKTGESYSLEVVSIRLMWKWQSTI